MRTIPTSLALIVLIVASLPASIAPCTPSTSPAAAQTPGADPYYVVVECGAAQLGCSIPTSDRVWIYDESNDTPGLQRGDTVKDDTCNGQIDPDDLVI